MSKHIAPTAFYQLPSGNAVHPCRLIHKDGSIMWKHALLNNNEFASLPLDLAHEAHIIKTAQRLEELNAWVSQDLNPWECLRPIKWYNPNDKGFDQGIAVLFVHTTLPSNQVFDQILKHKQEHETLTYDSGILRFDRC